MATVDERAAELRRAWWGEPYPRDASGDWSTAPSGDKERWRHVAHVAPAPPVSGDYYRRCPACNGSRFVGEGKRVDPYALCPVCNGSGFVPVAPSVTPGLLAAAQAVVDDAPVCPCPGCREEHEGHLEHLRAELAAATASPVVLTAEDREQLVGALRDIGETFDGTYSDGVCAMLGKLDDLGYALVRRPS